jgi:hypothetical protein
MKGFSSIIILLLLASSSLLHLGGFVDFNQTNENRNFAEAPKFDINHLDGYGTKMDKYLSDQFVLRTPLLETYHYLSYKLYRTSPNPEKLIIGKGNWFFQGLPEIELYNGKKRIETNALDSIIGEWRTRTRVLSAKNVNWRLGVIPIKHSIYPEYLPFYKRYQSSYNRTDTMINALNRVLNNQVIDARIDLKLAKQSSDVRTYRKNDNHINKQGGYVVYKAIMSSLKLSPLQEGANFSWEEYELAGGIHVMRLGYPEETETDWKPHFLNSQAISVDKLTIETPLEFGYPEDFQHHYSCPKAPNNLKLLVIHDSFGQRVEPFLKNTFSESLFLFDAWHYDTHLDVIESYKPDVVIYLTMEMLLDHYNPHHHVHTPRFVAQ